MRGAVGDQPCAEPRRVSRSYTELFERALGVPFPAGSLLVWLGYELARKEGAGAGFDLEALLDDLVIANRILAHEDVIDAFGHVSVRHPEPAGPLLPGPLAEPGAGRAR